MWNQNRTEDELKKIQRWKSELAFERRELLKEQKEARKNAHMSLNKMAKIE